MRLTPENIEEIKIRFAKAETFEELAQLLSWVYALKFPKRNEKNTILFEAKHLNYYAFKSANRYKQFTIKKKSGGERPISTPRYMLKTIQKCIPEILNVVFIPHFTATGFVPRKSIVDNAKVHNGKQFVFNTDLKDFFPSTEFRRIKAVFGLSRFNLTDANEINSNKEKKKISEEKGKEYLGYLIANLYCDNGCLPKGAPTDRDHHFPVKITFLSNKAELLDDPALINQLIDQVYQFIKMYWKSVNHQNLPVTIKYPEMVAEIFQYFTHDKLPYRGKESLWFL